MPGPKSSRYRSTDEHWSSGVIYGCLLPDEEEAVELMIVWVSNPTDL